VLFVTANLTLLRAMSKTALELSVHAIIVHPSNRTVRRYALRYANIECLRGFATDADDVVFGWEAREGGGVFQLRDSGRCDLGGWIFFAEDGGERRLEFT